MKKSKLIFLFDESGNKTGVLLKVADFEKMVEELEDYADYKMIKQRAKKKYKTYTKEEVMAEIFKR